jgi:hypothetical protein
MATSRRTPVHLEARPIRLDYRIKGGNVVVMPNDEDRFTMTIQEAALACKAGVKQLRFGRQFERTLLPRLGSWMKAHKNKIQKAFLTLGDGRLLFLIVRREVPYDETFENELSDLDISIARDETLDLIRLAVLALPCVSEETYASFLDNRMILEYGGPHGD